MIHRIYSILSVLALSLVIVPPSLYLIGSVSKPTMAQLMLAGTLIWFLVSGIRSVKS